MIESPTFLRNLAFLLYSANWRAQRFKTPADYLVDVGLLRQFMPYFGQWLDENRIGESPAAIRVVRRGLRLYTKICDWSLLDKGSSRDDLRSFTLRLKGFLK